MKLGITSTRAGLTPKQLDAADRLFLRLRPASLHTGCAIGGDEQLTVMARRRLTGLWIVGYPSDAPGQRSEVACRLCDKVHPPRPPLVRNANIVAAVEVLLACPAERAERRRGGTWSTIRRARRCGVSVWLIFPEGDIIGPEEN